MKIRKLIFVAIIGAMLAVLAACGQSYDPPKSSADLYGTSSDSGYKNDYLGFSITYPDGYTVLDKDQIDELSEKAAEKTKSLYVDDKAQESIDDSNTLAVALKHPLGYTGGFDSNISIGIQSMNSFYTGDIVFFAKRSIEATKQVTQGVTFGDVQSIKLDGKDAAVYDFTMAQDNNEVTQKQYVFASKNYIIIINIGAEDSGDMDELAKIVEGIKFNS